MRHDQSPEEIIVGLHRISWEHLSYIRGLSEILSKANFRDLDFKSQNAFRIILGTLNYIHKESLGVRKWTSEAITERGWKAEYPMEGHAEPIKSKWVGLSGDGACKTCRAKKSVVPKYNIKDYESLIPTVLQNLWAGFVFLETYRQHQLTALHEADFFGHEDGYIAESFYQNCGRLVSLGSICLGKPIQVYCSAWLHRNVPKHKLDIALTRSYDLPDISDVGHEKKWCRKCAANVIEMPVNIFELLGGSHDSRDIGG